MNVGDLKLRFLLEEILADGPPPPWISAQVERALQAIEHTRQAEMALLPVYEIMERSRAPRRIAV